jgi:SRSO17 transposase
MRALLGRTQWNQEKARDVCRDYGIERLGDPSGVLVLDETGFLKKGRHSVGVARQYSGTAGRIENCQVGVFLGYASPKGHALIDRRLYLPKDWIEDAERRRTVGVPIDVAFATKPKIGVSMVALAIEAGVPAHGCWATRFMAATRRCASCWRAVTSRMFSPFAATGD